ncbi:hypothetical protein PPYR_04429 [Photinus pyralis]|uniref:Uncharacterized protein n=1 Tax=Photinus pyralis TaxID=7054 RepID=A0A5N4AY92_PHOPY|nr:hypothetical protein PPYR_04429 [Photinus pyralis]
MYMIRVHHIREVFTFCTIPLSIMYATAFAIGLLFLCFVAFPTVNGQACSKAVIDGVNNCTINRFRLKLDTTKCVLSAEHKKQIYQYMITELAKILERTGTQACEALRGVVNGLSSLVSNLLCVVGSVLDWLLG